MEDKLIDPEPDSLVEVGVVFHAEELLEVGLVNCYYPITVHDSKLRRSKWNHFFGLSYL